MSDKPDYSNIYDEWFTKEVWTPAEMAAVVTSPIYQIKENLDKYNTTQGNGNFSQQYGELLEHADAFEENDYFLYEVFCYLAFQPLFPKNVIEILYKQDCICDLPNDLQVYLKDIGQINPDRDSKAKKYRRRLGKKDAWMLSEAVSLLCKSYVARRKNTHFPLDKAGYRKYEEILEIAESSAIAAKGEVKKGREVGEYLEVCFTQDGIDYVKPHIFIEWATRKGFWTPKGLANYINTNSASNELKTEKVLKKNRKSGTGTNEVLQKALCAFINEIEKRANDCGLKFDRENIIGSKKEFCLIIKNYCKAFKLKSTSTIDGYILSVGIKFPKHRKKIGQGKDYWLILFPSNSEKQK